MLRLDAGARWIGEKRRKGYVKGVHVSRKTQGCVGGKKGGDRKVGKRAGRHRPCNRPIASCSGGTCIVGKAARGENKNAKEERWVDCI